MVLKSGRRVEKVAGALDEMPTDQCSAYNTDGVHFDALRAGWTRSVFGAEE